MILFEEDFAKEHAIVDTTGGGNLSFVKMSLLLNQLGIKNNLFMLSLYDKDLLGIDPHNLKDDSLELKERISYEAKRNFWYYTRAVARIDAAGVGGSRYILNRANLAQAWTFLNSVDQLQVMGRQLGKTIGVQNIASWYIYVAAYNCTWGMFCKGNTLQQENVSRLKKLRDSLPKWMLYQSANDTNNKEGISYDALQNKFLTYVAQSDKQAAADQARGPSFTVEHWDEAAYYNNIDLSFPSATACMDAAGALARASGVPSAKILTTTAGDIDDPRGRWCFRTACDALRFSEKLYDLKNREALMDTLRTNSRNNYLYIEFNYKQLGKNDEWFEQVTRNKPDRIIAIDYLNEWSHGSNNTLVSKELMDKIQKSRREPITTTMYGSLVVKWYDDPNVLLNDENLRRKPYVMGLDTSDNVGRDFTTMCMLDPYDLHPVCTFNCNTTNLAFVAKAVMDLLLKFPRCIFIPERNKLGSMFLDFLFAETRRDMFDPLTRIYNMYYQKYTKEMSGDLYNLNYDDGEVRRNFGFTTSKSATSREFLYSTVMMTFLKLVGDRLYDGTVIDQIAGITIRNGRVDHSEKGHDDLLIAFLLAAYFILFGANHQLYGISPDEFLCKVNNDTGEEIDPDLKRQNAELKALLMDYRAKLKHCNNPIVKQGLQREIDKITNVLGDIPADDDKIISLEQAKHQASIDAQKNTGMNGFQMVAYM